MRGRCQIGTGSMPYRVGRSRSFTWAGGLNRHMHTFVPKGQKCALRRGGKFRNSRARTSSRNVVHSLPGAKQADILPLWDEGSRDWLELSVMFATVVLSTTNTVVEQHRAGAEPSKDLADVSTSIAG